MGSSILHRGISQRGVAAGYSLRSFIFRSANSSCLGARMMSTVRSDESPSSPVRSLPWLTLKPSFEGGDMVCKFYSLAENRVLSYQNRGVGGGGEESVVEMPDDNTKLVGSSHGWLALFNQDRDDCNDLYLLNPISGRQILLPPLGKSDYILKCIMSSSSPDEEECRAMISIGPSAKMAFCCPGHSSTEWIRIGNEPSYKNFVYSNRDKLFFCITGKKAMDLQGCFKTDMKMEAWDLRDTLSPRIDWIFEDKLEFDEQKYPDWSRGLKLACKHFEYLVLSEHSNELFLVMRHINPRARSDGSFVKYIYYDRFRGWDESFPYKTVGFDVYKIDRDCGRLRYMEGHLDGLVMFIGSNHSFAMEASESPADKLKPNSIYFTDESTYIPQYRLRCNFGGHDNGVFDYENGTFSPCPSPCEYHTMKRIVPPPMWFTPDPTQLS